MKLSKVLRNYKRQMLDASHHLPFHVVQTGNLRSLRALWQWNLSQLPPARFANQDQSPEILALAKPVGDLANTPQRQAVFVGDVAQIIVAALRATGAV